MKNTLNKELASQYAHIWRVFERLVNDFDDTSWIYTGRNAMRPALLSLHILQATHYYIEDTSSIELASGRPFDIACAAAGEENLPLRNDVLLCIQEFAQKTESWIFGMDPGSLNDTFGWAGKTKLGVVIFLLKHSVYHLGELSALLNESKNGEVEDHYVQAL